MDIKPKQVILAIIVFFSVFEVLIASGLLTIGETPLLPPNLQTNENWYDNPVIWVIGITIIVNFAGYVENVVIKDQAYDYNKFAETFFKYLPMLVIFSQFLPNQQGALLAFGFDYIKRALEKRQAT